LLKAAGKDTLLEMQGLKEAEADKPAVNKESTMEVTAKVQTRALFRISITKYNHRFIA